MIHKASQLIAEAFDNHDVKYGNKIEEYGNSSAVEAGFNIDNGPSVLVRFISTDEDNDVAVRVFSILKVTNDKRDQICAAVNAANRKMRYIKFTLDDDGDINAEYDIPIRVNDETVGEVAFEIFVRFMQIIDEVYPSFMKALWS